MGAYSVAQAKAKLNSLLQAVEQGEEVTITRRGIAVATLSAVKKSKTGIDWNLVDQTRERSKVALRGVKLNAQSVVRDSRDYRCRFRSRSIVEPGYFF